MKLIVGLGNPGEKYQKSRHNLGFLALDTIASKLRVRSSWFMDKRFKSKILKIKQLRTMNDELTLVKPATFVNNSGTAVKKIVKFFKIATVDILIIRDDIDLPEGKIRGPKAETGSGGHLGVESIQQSLRTNSFYQLKIGVGRPFENIDPADFVLQKVTDYQWENFENLIEKEVIGKVQSWIDG